MSVAPDVASRSPTALSRSRSAATLAWRLPTRSRSTGGTCRPAAARHDRLVLADRLRRGLDRRRRQRRQRRLRHQDGARGGIKALAEIGLLVLPDRANAGTRPRWRRRRSPRMPRSPPRKLRRLQPAPVAMRPSRKSSLRLARLAVGENARETRAAERKRPRPRRPGQGHASSFGITADRGSGRSRTARAGAATCSASRTRRN